LLAAVFVCWLRVSFFIDFPALGFLIPFVTSEMSLFLETALSTGLEPYFLTGVEMSALNAIRAFC
jgi:hypothetical protein